MRVKTREWAVQEDIMMNLLYQGANRDDAALLAGSTGNRA